MYGLIYMTETHSYFVDAEIEFKGRVYHLKKSTADRWVSATNTWHNEADPSTWLCEKAFSALRKKFKPLSQDAVLVLLAKAMKITVEQLVNTIKWHEEYMRWHEGMPDYRVLDEDA